MLADGSRVGDDTIGDPALCQLRARPWGRAIRLVGEFDQDRGLTLNPYPTRPQSAMTTVVEVWPLRLPTASIFFTTS
jgi:hypothetical protein